MKPARIDNTIDHFPNVICLFQIFRNDSVNLFRIVMRIFRRRDLASFFCWSWNRTEDVAHDAQRVRIILSAVVGDPGNTAMYIGPAKFLSRDFLAGGSLYEGRAAKKNRTLFS